MSITMAGPHSHFDYPVVVTECDGGYDLCIRELLLFVRAGDLRQAYEELIKRKQEVIDAAQSIGALDELPPTEWPAVLEVADVRAPGSAIASRLRKIWNRLFRRLAGGG